MRIGRYGVAILLGSIASSLAAQSADVLVFGVIKDVGTGQRVTEITVTASDRKWGRYADASIGESGKYEMALGRNGEWLVTYSAPGYVSKRLMLLLTGPTKEDWAGGFGMNVDMTLIKAEPGVDYALLDEPFGRCTYNSGTGNFEWDLAYTEKMRARQAKLLKR